MDITAVVDTIKDWSRRRPFATCISTQLADAETDNPIVYTVSLYNLD